jgi:3-oxoadipate CoA-transferase beta subunit
VDQEEGAKHVQCQEYVYAFVMMTLLTRECASKIVEACSHPITGGGCVTLVHTDKAVFHTGPEGVTVRETFGCTSKSSRNWYPSH